MRSKYSIHIVTWNSEDSILNCVNSVINQDYDDWKLIVVDNNSSDKTYEVLEKSFSKNEKITLIKNQTNKGFAGAHNQAIGMADSEYIVIMNPDVVICKDFLSKTDDFLEKTASKYEKLGSISPKIYRVFDLKSVNSNIIDSLYLQIDRKRQVTNAGEEEKDKDEYNNTKIIFGPSGALAIYSRKALEDVKINNEYFDEMYHTYKEDIDIAWRMYRYGWVSLYAPCLYSYHIRNARKNNLGVLNVKKILNQRKNKNKFINMVSYRNHIYNLIKNESCTDFKYDFFHILFFEIKKIIFLLFFEPSTLKGLADVVKNFPQIFKKRKLIQKRSVNKSLRSVLVR